MRVTLKSLSIENFGSFVGQHEFQFQNGLTIILGSSGAGKSTIFRAVAFCLGFSPLSAKDSQNDRSDKKFQLCLKLGVDDKDVEIRRGASNVFVVDGVEKTDASSEVPKLVQAMLGTPDAIEALTYRDQMKAFDFLGLSDADIKEFLTPLVVGMKDVEEEIDFLETVELKRRGLALQEADLELSRIIVEELTEKRSLADLDQLLRKAKSDREDMGREYTVKILAVTQLWQAICGGLNKTIQEIKSRKPGVSEQDRLSHVVARYKGHIKDVDKELAADQQEFQKGWDVVYRAYLTSKDKVSQVEGLKERLADLQKAKVSLSVGLCGTCGQKIFDNTLAEDNTTDIEAVELKIKSLEHDPISEPKRVNWIAPEILVTKKENLCKKLDELQLEYASVVAQNQQFQLERQNEVKVYQTRLLEADLEKKNSLADLRDEHDRNTLGIDAAILSLKQSIELKTKYDKQLAAQEGAQDKRTQAEYAKNSADAYHKMLKGFRSHVFEELLNDIADHTNRILAQADNTSDVTVAFKTVKEQAKTTKDAITPVFTFGGVERSLKTASGGMGIVIRFAVSLGVANAVATRSGKDFAFLLLDEVFHSLNQEVRKQCLTILEQYATNRQVIIVDHGADFQAMFANTIEIENQNGASRIKQ